MTPEQVREQRLLPCSSTSGTKSVCIERMTRQPKICRSVRQAGAEVAIHPAQRHAALASAVVMRRPCRGARAATQAGALAARPCTAPPPRPRAPVAASGPRRAGYAPTKAPARALGCIATARRRGDLQSCAIRLDPRASAVLVNEGVHLLWWRPSSAGRTSRDKAPVVGFCRRRLRCGGRATRFIRTPLVAGRCGLGVHKTTTDGRQPPRPYDTRERSSRKVRRH